MARADTNNTIDLLKEIKQKRDITIEVRLMVGADALPQQLAELLFTTGRQRVDRPGRTVARLFVAAGDEPLRVQPLEGVVERRLLDLSLFTEVRLDRLCDLIAVHLLHAQEAQDEEVVVKTGFETTIRKRFDLPMPEQVSWETDTIEKMEAFEFDDPYDRRRYFEAGDNQIAGVGDGFERNSPPWVETVKSLHQDFPVYGSITEASEITTRLLGQLNTLTWIGEYPERFGEQLLRIGDFSYEVAKAQIEAADGLRGSFEYDVDLFDRSTIERLAAHDVAGAKKAIVEEVSNSRKAIMERIMQEEATHWHVGTGS